MTHPAQAEDSLGQGPCLGLGLGQELGLVPESGPLPGLRLELSPAPALDPTLALALALALAIALVPAPYLAPCQPK